MAYIDATEFRGPIAVTLGYIIVYYIFLYGGAAYKIAKGIQKKKAAEAGLDTGLVSDSEKATEAKIMLMIDRSTGNTLEQMVPFVLSLWLHAVFVSTKSATTMGTVYVAFRAFYPIAFYLGMPYLLISTMPGYAIIFGMLHGVVSNANL